ncbi:cation:proton antiporter [Gulosibacter bifidus]|uniref:Cation:proton antiporter n=1 Tax=Gulosibacter bifidus TaxID=272239 RepID=A0ABW5RGF1_9MICO|nr:cation:proton antiporter [Gulosibacter bifidus]
MNAFSFALLLVVALIAPLLSLWKRWGIPIVVVEILIGLVIGRSGLGVIDPADPTLSFMAGTVGFALVMFVAGTHVPVGTPGIGNAMVRGGMRAGLIGVLAVPAGFGIAALFGTDNAWLYSVLLASSSAAVAMPILQGVPRRDDYLALVAQIAVADIACIVALPLALEPSNALVRCLGLAVVTLLAVGVFAVLKTTADSRVRQIIHDETRERGLALELRISLALLFVVVMVASLFGISAMFAGFMLGVAVAAAGEPRRVAKQVFGLTEGFFGPLFFIWLGTTVDVKAAFANPQMLLLGLVLGVSALILHASMVLTRQPFGYALLTSVQLGVPAAAVSIGGALGVFREDEAAAILLGAIISLAATVIAKPRLKSAS